MSFALTWKRAGRRFAEGGRQPAAHLRSSCLVGVQPSPRPAGGMCHADLNWIVLDVGRVGHFFWKCVGKIPVLYFPNLLQRPS